MLYIHGKLLVNNDGNHGMRLKCRARKMSKGYQRINIAFYENGAGAGCIVQWQGPGILNGRRRQVVPFDALTAVKGD